GDSRGARRGAGRPAGRNPLTMQGPTVARPAPPRRRPGVRLPALDWLYILWWSTISVLSIVLAPFTFSWSGLAVCAILYVLTALGVTLGYHRLLTHRSFRTPRVVEYALAVLGGLASQGGPLHWVAVHRI